MPKQYRVPEIQQQAREAARETLVRSAMFRAMSLGEQQDVYHAIVDDNYNRISRHQGLSTAMVKGFKGYDPGFKNSINDFEDLVDSVDFPQFVADLLKAVFDANISVQKAQTDDFIRLMREATKSTADFLKKTDDEDAFAYLVEKPNSQYNISMEEDPEGGSKLTLTTPEGEPVDMDDNEVKAAIMDAKIAMAKEHRAALREVILMGVTRLVVDKGEIEASVDFTITAKRKSDDTTKNTNVNVLNAEASYESPLRKVFGGVSGTISNTNTNIAVKSSNQDADDNLTASLKGRVKIVFKSDYFKLDNFANMYADGGVAALQPLQQGAVPGLPAGG